MERRTGMDEPDEGEQILEAVRQACLQAAVDAYEDAGIRGLCDEGRWECALTAIRGLDLEAALASHRRTSTPTATRAGSDRD